MLRSDRYWQSSTHFILSPEWLLWSLRKEVEMFRLNVRRLGKSWTLASAGSLALGLAAATALAPAPALATEVELHNFACPPQGATPYAGVIRDSAGNLYGTTFNGGAVNKGIVYKVDTTGHQTVLYSFKGGGDGSNPLAGVILDSAGDLYGTTEYGGAANAGIVYKLDNTGHETVLYSFTGGADGSNPFAGVILDSAGNLYGTTVFGGAGSGVVFKLDSTGHETVLHSFTGGDGAAPYAGVTFDSAGNLYGTTNRGGSAGKGVVYKLANTGQETVLYSFTGEADGGNPTAGVTLDSAGNLYGTTERGGHDVQEGYRRGDGVVYKVDTAGNETVLFTFFGSSGALPYAGVTLDSAGNLYGTTLSGTVYKLNTSGQETVLYTFTGHADGGSPQAGVILDSAGNLYGTTFNGGTAGLGVVYKLDATGHETVLFGFPGSIDGSSAVAGLTADSVGNLYGTTEFGGAANAGVVYKLDTTGHETVLYTFTGGAEGSNPLAGVTLDSAGNLYGTTEFGGAANAGVVYKLDTTGHETVLHSFTGSFGDGGFPAAGVILDSAGNLYGTTPTGGVASSCCGVVYKVDTTGHLTELYTFQGGDNADGKTPTAGVIRDSAGNLYGTTQFGGNGTYAAGVVYKVDTTGRETVLYNFNGDNDGGNPTAGLIRDSAGNFYGTTQGGGAEGYGVVYKLDTGGHETVLWNFTGAEGGLPYAGVIRDSAGNLYGTSTTAECDQKVCQGSVYKLGTNGQVMELHGFTGGTDGGLPYGGVIRDSAGNLYGTAFQGGKQGTGVVFKITP
jgi:uncharacterized repeat protein (TIGR03803 family)